MRRLTPTFAALMVLALCSPPGLGQSAAPAKAATEAPAPTVPVPLPGPRHGHRIEKVDGGLLSFGGFGDVSAPNRETEQTWWLAPGAKEWRRRADMSAGRTFFGSAVIDGTVYAIGDGAERYDLRADRWSRVVPAGRLPRSHFGTATVGSTVYVLGGYGGPVDKLWAVDLPVGKLRGLPPPPGFKRGDHFHCLHALGGELHVVGGLDGATFTPKPEHWVLTNPRADAGAPPAECWRAETPPPAAVWAKSAVQAVADDKLYLFGDFGAFRFDPKTREWNARMRPPFGVVMPQAVTQGGIIWVIGGEPLDAKAPRCRILLRYDVALDLWTDLSN